MSKLEFRMKIEELNRIGIIRITADHYMEPRRRGSNFFVKSPISTDKTWSCCLYPSNNRFCDFAGGNKSGDVVGFISYVRGLNNWEALKLLCDYYAISDTGEQDREERRRAIQLQQAEERKRAARKQEFYKALFDEISQIKEQIEKCRLTLSESKIEPFSDLWTDIRNEIQRAEYKLDVLTAADMATYRRMKSNPDLGLSSDRPVWLLDCLEILAEVGTFKATEGEIKEVTAQRNFELCRMPGRDRRCKVEW